MIKTGEEIYIIAQLVDTNWNTAAISNKVRFEFR